MLVSSFATATGGARGSHSTIQVGKSSDPPQDINEMVHNPRLGMFLSKWISWEKRCGK